MRARDVRVWTAHASAWAHGDVPRLAALLGQGERERAAAFRFEADARAWTVAHVLLRAVLAAELGLQPDALRFVVRAGGRPALADDALHFSLSRNRDAIALAVASAPVGIDAERVDARHADPLLLTPFMDASGVRSPDDFFGRWTALEACAKALGTGLGEALPPLRIDPGEGARWSARALQDGRALACGAALDGVPGCKVSLALAGPCGIGAISHRTLHTALEIEQLCLAASPHELVGAA